MRQFRRHYPHVTCVQADGCALPFKEASVHIAQANAVLEHVAREHQARFSAELARVARRRALLSVSDRLCPVEVHSGIPLLHWLPNWRTLFKAVGASYWAMEGHLACIFTKRSLTRLLRAASTGEATWQVRRQRLFGLPISLVATLDR